MVVLIRNLGLRVKVSLLESLSGTQIRDKEFNFLLRDLKEHDEKVIVAYSGERGCGNAHQSSTTII